MERVTIAIQDMSCGHCVKAVEQALGEIDGVQVEGVQIGSATILVDPARVSRDRIVSAIEEAGYRVAQPTGLGR
ncbi:MAG TPA: cation transporter [Longimicrobiales bacterium]|mgnify:CR=1 FL=1|nr:cation transporter [Longimicrobiales bacterium]